MSSNLTVAPRREFQSFHDLPIVLDLDRIEADVAILGIPYGAPYSMDDTTVPDVQFTMITGGRDTDVLVVFSGGPLPTEAHRALEQALLNAR